MLLLSLNSSWRPGQGMRQVQKHFTLQSFKENWVDPWLTSSWLLCSLDIPVLHPPRGSADPIQSTGREGRAGLVSTVRSPPSIPTSPVIRTPWASFLSAEPRAYAGFSLPFVPATPTAELFTSFLEPRTKSALSRTGPADTWEAFSKDRGNKILLELAYQSNGGSTMICFSSLGVTN